MIFILCCFGEVVKLKISNYLVYFDDFHDSFCDQGEFDVCYEMQRLVS